MYVQSAAQSGRKVFVEGYVDEPQLHYFDHVQRIMDQQREAMNPGLKAVHKVRHCIACVLAASHGRKERGYEFWLGESAQVEEMHRMCVGNRSMLIRACLCRFCDVTKLGRPAEDSGSAPCGYAF